MTSHFDLFGPVMGGGGLADERKLPSDLDILAMAQLSNYASINIQEPPSGDYQLNGVVDGADLLKWQRGESPNALSSSDLADWKANYGTYAGQVTALSTTVPEPATGIMLMLGMTAKLFCRR